MSNGELGEAFAAKVAVEAARDFGWQRVSFEGDALNVIHALQGKIKRGGQAQLFIDDAIILVGCPAFLMLVSTFAIASVMRLPIG